jgi:hypothetical protein
MTKAVEVKATTSVAIKLYAHADIGKRIEDMHKSGQRLQTEMHKLACSVLHHLGETKDIRYTLAFIQAMPEMARVNGLHAWFEAFGPIKFNTPEAIKDGAPAAICVKDGKTKLGDAMAKPFWKFKAKEGQPYQPLVIEEYAAQQVKRLKADIEAVPLVEGDKRGKLLAAFLALQ